MLINALKARILFGELVVQSYLLPIELTQYLLISVMLNDQ
jgi:hypothetical protein